MRALSISAVTAIMLLLASSASAEIVLNVGCVGPWVQAPAAEYERAHPGVRVDIRNAASRDPMNPTCPERKSGNDEIVRAFLQSDAIGDGNPSQLDRAALWSGPVPIDAMHFTDLTELVGKSPVADVLAALPDGLLRAVQANGRLWAIPGELDERAYAVRGDVFAAAGLAIPRDWDWNDFLLDAKKAFGFFGANPQFRRIKTKGGGSDTYPARGLMLPPAPDPGLATGSPNRFWLSLFLGAGRPLIDAGGHGHFESEAHLRVLTTLREWLDSGAVMVDGSRDEKGHPIIVDDGLGGPAFSFGLLAGTGSWLFAKTTIDAVTGERVPNPRQWVSVPIPHPPGMGPNPVPMRIVGWMLTSDIPTIKIPYALDFTAWLVRHGDQGYRDSGFLPPVPQDGMRIFGDEARFYYEQMATAQIASSAESEVWLRFNKYLGRFYDGQLTPLEFARLVDNGEPGS